MRYDSQMSMKCDIETVAAHPLPSWVRWVSSEGLLMFGAPFLGWVLVLLFAFFLSSDVRGFKFACSIIWCGFALTAVVMLLATTALSSIATRVPNHDLSTKKPFSYFYVLAQGLSQGHGKLVLLLGWCKALSLSVIGFALWGGLLVIGMWLPSMANG